MEGIASNLGIDLGLFYAIITISLILIINVFAFIHSYLFVTGKIRIGKIQGNPSPDIKYFIKHIPRVLINIISLMLLSGLGIYFFHDNTIFASIHIINEETVLPMVVIAQLAVIFIIDDTFFYFIHRLIHVNKFLYKKIHRIHHEANMPIAIDYIYAHPIEWMVGYIGPFIGIFLYGGVSIYTFWLYLIIRNLHEIFVHSGIKSSFFMYKIFPLFANNEHHDIHHSKYECNYASTLTLWDTLFKTRIKYSEK